MIVRHPRNPKRDNIFYSILEGLCFLIHFGISLLVYDMELTTRESFGWGIITLIIIAVIITVIPMFASIVSTFVRTIRYLRGKRSSSNQRKEKYEVKPVSKEMNQGTGLGLKVKDRGSIFKSNKLISENQIIVTDMNESLEALDVKKNEESTDES